MASGCLSLVRFLTMLVNGGVCFVVSALTLMPELEQGQNESRLAQAWTDVRCIRDATIAEGQLSFGDLSPEDPWGQPYWLVPGRGGKPRIVSSGPNGTSPDDGLDEDDVHSDMTDSPTKPISDRRNRQWLLALAAPVAAWLLLLGLYFRTRRRPDEPDYVYSHDR